MFFTTIVHAPQLRYMLVEVPFYEEFPKRTHSWPPLMYSTTSNTDKGVWLAFSLPIESYSLQPLPPIKFPYKLLAQMMKRNSTESVVVYY